MKFHTILACAMVAAACAAGAAPLGGGDVTVETLAGGVRVHNYDTRDALLDQAQLIETANSLVAIEVPAFRRDIAAWNEYAARIGKPVDALLLSAHPSEGSAPGAPVLATAASRKAMESGSTRAIADGLGKAFGNDFVRAFARVTDELPLGESSLGGVRILVLGDGDNCIVALPEQKVAFLHMLGEDTHSIVAGAAHADFFVSQLERLKALGVRKLYSGHHTPEDAAALDSKIAYLKAVKSLAARSQDAASFTWAVKAAYPKMLGDNYLQMSAGFFFPAK